MRLSTLAIGLLVLLTAWLIGGCESDAPATLIRLVIDSDLEVGTELTRLEVRILDPDGKKELRRQDFALEENREGTRYVLPLTVKLAPESQRSSTDFRLVVTGVGPVGPGGSEIEVVEQQALTSFRPGEQLRLDIFLARKCLFELCREEEETSSNLTCDAETGACADVPTREDLPRAGDDHSPAGGEDKGDAEVDGGLMDSEVAPNDNDSDVQSADGSIDGGRDAGNTGPDGTSESTSVCGVAALDSASSPCGANQHCTMTPNAHCECDAGYQSGAGGECVNIDDCVGHTCQHGSQCRDGITKYSCDCTGTGYEGEYCQSDIDECSRGQRYCPTEYPCANSPGTSYCLGQAATWPMPDSTPGAKNAPNYVLAPNIVFDSVTGLVWQRARPTSYPKCGPGGTPAPYCNRPGALSYCADLDLDGYTDWRVPSYLELISLLDLSRADPALSAQAFGSSSADAVPVWSSTSGFGALDGYALLVKFDAGSTGLAIPGTTTAGVRCVRGARVSSLPTERYAATQTAVEDQWTGLTWSSPGNGTYTWDAAKSACLSLGRRLPTLKELATLYTSDASAVSPVVGAVPAETAFWSSTPTSGVQNFAFYLSLPEGGVYGDAQTVPARAICVN